MVSRLHKGKRQGTLKKSVLNGMMIVSFLGFSGSAFFQLFQTAFQKSSPLPVQTEAPGSDRDFLAQEQGYQLVLQREPNNQAALEGLAQARLDRQDYAGAIAPLEQLVKLYPDQSGYREQLADAKQRLN